HRVVGADGVPLELLVRGDAPPRRGQAPAMPDGGAHGGAVEPPTRAPSPAPSRPPSDPDVEAITSTPPTLQRSEEVTDVEEDLAYGQAMADLRSFYATMETEAQAVHRVRGHRFDGQYDWAYGHDAQAFLMVSRTSSSAFTCDHHPVRLATPTSL